MPLNRCRSWRGQAFEVPVMETNLLAGITTSEFSPALKTASVFGSLRALIITRTVGRLIIELLFGGIGLAILGGAAWRFLVRH